MVTTVLTEPNHIAEYLVSEAAGYRSREVAVIAGGVVIQPGTVLAKVTVGGKLVPLAPAAADGSEAAVAILYQGVAATETDVARTITSRDAEVNGNILTWPAGITAPQKATATAQLAALGIIVRN